MLEIFLNVWANAEISVEEIASFMHSPFGTIEGLKMLDFFRFLGLAGLTVISIFAVASLFIQNFCCCYLCPYGAVLGLASNMASVYACGPECSVVVYRCV